MSFDRILQTIARECNGVLGVALVGEDGIAVAQVEPPRDASPSLRDGMGTAAAEFGRILAEIRKASDALGGGALQETVVCLSRFSFAFRQVEEDLVLVVAVAPDGNLAKARYLLRRHLAEIRQEL